MKKLIVICLLLFPMIKAELVQGQNEKFKALFLYNFTKYIDWPAAYQQGDFIIGVFGSTAMENELATISSMKKVGNQNIIVKKITNPGQIGKCHIVYLAPSKSSNLRTVITSAQGINALIVSDGEGLVQQGAGINFVETAGKQGFEIKKDNIESKGLKVSGSLLSLGTVVN